MKLGTANITPPQINARVAIVAAQWHAQIMDRLIDGARRAARESSAHTHVIRVPGSFELPIAAQHAARLGTRLATGAEVAAQFDAIVALGVVIRGETPHFDYVCSAATDGLARVALDSGKPVGFGLLTCDTVEQALDRAGGAGINGEGASEDKGYESMTAALATLAALSNMHRRE